MAAVTKFRLPNRRAVAVAGAILFGLAASPAFAAHKHPPQQESQIEAQTAAPSDAASALAGALSAACRANENEFANYLTADNAAAFHALPPDERASFMKRFSLSDEAGKPLISSDDRNHTVLRCMTAEQTAEFRFGAVRMRENLAFIPVSVVQAQQTQFGLVRENGGWRLLSLGLVLLDIPELSRQWAESDVAAREDAAISTLHSLAQAIHTYHDAYAKLPGSLAAMGPAPKNQISDEQADLIDAKLASGSVGGYQFRYRLASPANLDGDPTFEIAATPEDYGKGGRRSFLLDGDGRLHGADKHGEMATADDPPVTESAQQ
ncbi:MAG TPA: hypothetical protein VMB02_08335 [Candidatus Aquilonibacter sp.]|nr:hypothetical protein [Candidatus Aquilonibacter sp.]